MRQNKEQYTLALPHLRATLPAGSHETDVKTPSSFHRDRPVPIPAPGIQLVNLSHVEDLAEMMAAVPGNSAAVKQHFNLASDRAITFDGQQPSQTGRMSGHGSSPTHHSRSLFSKTPVGGRSASYWHL